MTPVKPEFDPLLSEMVDLLDADGRPAAQLARRSGLSTSTLRNWRKGAVKRPQALSIQMAAKALGYKLQLVEVSNVRDIRSGRNAGFKRAS